MNAEILTDSNLIGKVAKEKRTVFNADNYTFFEAIDITPEEPTAAE